MKTKIILLLTFLFAVFSAALHAAEKNDSTKIYFFNAYDELKSMVEGKKQPDFERAVFISENPYHNNDYSYFDFQKVVNLHLLFIVNLAAANDYSDSINFIAKVKANGRFDIDEIIYTPQEKQQLYDNAVNNWAIFTYMNDTTGLYPFINMPFSYSSNDPFGIKDWSNSQVLNLLSSNKQEGNCFSLTAFFKIMADRLKTGAYLCTAPQHIYIQHQDIKGDYYNVELATAGHPGDGMLQTLTYTTSTAIVNGISLRSYDDRQSIGLCMVNLAKAYEHKFNTKDDDFLLQCAETVLQNDSLNLNALLLKHQVLNERMLKIMSQNKTVSLSKLTNEQTFKELEKHLARLHRLGYIQMPMDVQEMVLNGFQPKEGEKIIDRNPKPFTIEGVPEEDNKYLTLTGGLFQEVFESKKFEEYGQFTFDTETKTIAAIDTSKKNVFLIDPVAFAYDFGARGYNPQTGMFMSIDPLARKYPMWSPYSAFGNNPITFVDPDGRKIWIYYETKNAEGSTVIDKVQYHNGKLYDKEGNSYTGNDEYVIKVSTDLFLIGADDSKLQRRINKLDRSKFNHRIELPVILAEGNSNRTDDGLRAMEDKRTGSITEYDPDATTNVAGVKRDATVGLVHELLEHGYDRDNGTFNDDEKPGTGIAKSEIQAVNTENRRRAVTGDDMKKSYGGISIPDRLLKKIPKKLSR